MSITFYGKTTDDKPIMLDIEHPAYLNMNSANARAFLLFLGMDPGDEPAGEATIPEARRAVIRARAAFDRHARQFIREGRDTKRSGQCRVTAGAIDEGYLAMRLTSFERFLIVAANRGATSIYWA